jgi:antitoxin component of MazEF toxin-antitoxin module
MTVTLKEKQPLVVPPSVQRQAGIKPGDRLEFKISAGTITITPVERTYKPTKAEMSAIRKGEAAIASGDSVSLDEFLNVDNQSRRTRPKSSRKISS